MQIVNIITQYYPSFFKALGITLQMTVISLLCATVLGVIFGLFKVSDFKILKLIADVYIDIIRGTPLLVQVMIMMYGVGSVLKPYGFQWSNIGGAFTAGCVALSLNAGPIWRKSSAEASRLLTRARWRRPEVWGYPTARPCAR